jgi:hypothetical protein
VSDRPRLLTPPGKAGPFRDADLGIPEWRNCQCRSPQSLAAITAVHRVVWLPTGGQEPLIGASGDRVSECVSPLVSGQDLCPVRNRSLTGRYDKVMPRPSEA